MTPEQKLDEALIVLLEGSTLLIPGSKEFDDQMRLIQTLLSAKEKLSSIESEERTKIALAELELKKLEKEIEYKTAKDAKDIEVAVEQAKLDRELKAKEIEVESERIRKENVYRAIDVGLQTGLRIGSDVMHEALTNARMRAGWKFEKDGIVTSPTFKGLLSNVFKKF